MAAELVETSRLFARTVGRIDPAWVEPLAGDLLKRTYGEPHWEKKQGAVVAYERVTLFGVPIVQRRRVQYSRIDPVHSRELFIRHALVEGEWESQQAFDRANREAPQGTRAARGTHPPPRHPARRRERLRVLRRPHPGRRRDDPRLRGLVAHDPPGTAGPAHDAPVGPARTNQRPRRPKTTSSTPPSGGSGDQRLAIQYRFEPGARTTASACRSPSRCSPRMREEGFDWQVPRPPQGTRHRAHQVAAEADPQERRARCRLGREDRRRAARRRPDRADGVVPRHPRQGDPAHDLRAGLRVRLRPVPGPRAPAADVGRRRRARSPGRGRQAGRRAADQLSDDMRESVARATAGRRRRGSRPTRTRRPRGRTPRRRDRPLRTPSSAAASPRGTSTSCRPSSTRGTARP